MIDTFIFLNPYHAFPVMDDICLHTNCDISLARQFLNALKVVSGLVVTLSLF